MNRDAVFYKRLPVDVARAACQYVREHMLITLVTAVVPKLGGAVELKGEGGRNFLANRHTQAQRHTHIGKLYYTIIITNRIVLMVATKKLNSQPRPHCGSCSTERETGGEKDKRKIRLQCARLTYLRET